VSQPAMCRAKRPAVIQYATYGKMHRRAFATDKRINLEPAAWPKLASGPETAGSAIAVRIMDS